MTVMFGLSFSTAARIAPRGSKLAAGVAEEHGSDDTRAGEAGAVGGPLQRGERPRRLLEQHPTRGGELDVAAVSHEQVSAERAIELVDLIAQRRLGNVEPGCGAAKMELLGNGQEVARLARLEIDRRRLSLTRNTGLGQKRPSRFSSCKRKFSAIGGRSWRMSTAGTDTSLEEHRRHGYES
jgi:hypothetical protein